VDDDDVDEELKQLLLLRLVALVEDVDEDDVVETKQLL